jgi:hypothetical protein
MPSVVMYTCEEESCAFTWLGVLNYLSRMHKMNNIKLDKK